MLCKGATVGVDIGVVPATLARVGVGTASGTAMPITNVAFTRLRLIFMILLLYIPNIGCYFRYYMRFISDTLVVKRANNPLHHDDHLAA